MALPWTEQMLYFEKCIGCSFDACPSPGLCFLTGECQVFLLLLLLLLLLLWAAVAGGTTRSALVLTSCQYIAT